MLWHSFDQRQDRFDKIEYSSRARTHEPNDLFLYARRDKIIFGGVIITARRTTEYLLEVAKTNI